MIPLMRKRLTERLAALGDRNEGDEILARYREALIQLGDVQTFVSSVNWLPKHPKVAWAISSWLVSPTGDAFDTPFEEQREQIRGALKKLVNSGQPAMKKVAESALAAMSAKEVPIDALQLGRTLEAQLELKERREREKLFANLRTIQDAKIRWFKTNTNATVVTGEDLSRLIEGGFPKPPKGGYYEIGAKDEFPYYVPPLPPDDFNR
jgi:hypothetical protein